MAGVGGCVSDDGIPRLHTWRCSLGGPTEAPAQALVRRQDRSIVFSGPLVVRAAFTSCGITLNGYLPDLRIKCSDLWQLCP